MRFLQNFQVSSGIRVRLLLCGAGLVALSPLVHAAGGWSVAWLKAATGAGYAVDGSSPGWAWFHHSSPRAEAGPSPRVKYRDAFHTSDRLQIGTHLSESGEILRSSPDGVVLLQGEGFDLGLGPSTEVRLTAARVQLFSGEVWVECRGGTTPGEMRFLSAHVEVEVRECPAVVHVKDDEFSNASVQVGASSGKWAFRARVDGESNGEFNLLSTGEKVQLHFPANATGVDNQRFFAAMEAEPEFEREALSPDELSRTVRLRSAPVPRPSPTQSDGAPGLKVGN